MTQSHVILGAYGGVGEALCRRLVERGARVLMAGRDAQRLAQLAADIGGETFALDATRSEEVEECLRRAVEIFGRLDGVANCVGSLLLKPAHATTDHEWSSVLATNLGSAFAVVRAAGLVMAAHGGSVVLVSSTAARIGLANHEAIAAAKAGIEGLARAAAASYAPKGLRVNCVAPGLTRTPLTSRMWQNDLMVKASAGMHALGRLGAPEEIASAIGWLLDAEQAWVTGQVIGVDGGLSRVRSRS
jgi:3-oxoacyl-[acyl-carrier protein] reductase